MPQITHKGLPFQGRPFFKQGMLLPEFLSLLNTQVNEGGKILTSVSVNHETVDLLNPDTKKTIAERDVVDFESASPFELARSSLQDALDQFDDFMGDINEVINGLISGEREKSYKRFTLFASDFRGIIQLLQTLETTFGFDFEGIQVNGKSIRAISEHMIDILSQIKTSMENEDDVTLADLLEYEIKVVFSSDLKNTLETLSSLLQEQE